MQHTIDAKERFDEQVQDKIGDSKRQSEVDDDPFLDAYVPVAQGVGFTVPSLGQ